MSRRLALVIGNSDYLDAKLARLAAPGEDVNDLAEVLRTPSIGGFDEVTSLVNASAPVVRRSIARFFTDKRPDDLLLLYFSGHGVRDDHGRLYLAVQDTEYDLLNATAIPAGFVTDEMDRSRSRRQVLILDCCHSGAFAQGAKGAPGQSVGTASAFEGTGYGRVVLTATDSTQFAWEGDQLVGEADNSVFTHHVLAGLRTGAADTDGDGRITLDELYDYVYEQVVNQTPKQTPRKFTYNQQGEVVLALNPHAAPKPVTLPQDVLAAAHSPLAGVREGVVRDLEHLLRGADAAMAGAAREALERLKADDSRRVSAAARAALGLDPTSTQTPWTAAPPASAAPVPAKEQDQPPVRPAEPAASEGRAGSPPRTAVPAEGGAAARPQAPEQAGGPAAASGIKASSSTPGARPTEGSGAGRPQADAPGKAQARSPSPTTATPAEGGGAAQSPAADAAQPARPTSAGAVKAGAPPSTARPREGSATPKPQGRTEAPAGKPPARRSADSTSPRQAMKPAEQAPPVRQSAGPPASALPRTDVPSAEQADGVAAGLAGRMGASVEGAQAPSMIVPQRVAAVLVGVGCALGWGLAKLALNIIASLPGETFWPSRAVYWAIAYTATGLVLGLVLQLRRPALPLLTAGGLTAAWAAAAVAGFIVRYVIENHAHEVFGQLMGLGVVGVFGGRALGNVLHRAGGWPAPRSRAAVIITAGWVAGLWLTMLADWVAGWNIPPFVLGAVAGLIGGEVLFRQLGQAGRAPDAGEAPAGVLTTPLTPVLLLAAALIIVGFVAAQIAQTVYAVWSDAPSLLVEVVSTVVIGPLAGAALAVVIGLVHRPLGAAGMLALAVIWGAAGVVHAAIIFLLSQVSVDGTLPANLLDGAVGGAATAGFVAWRLQQKPSLGLMAASAGAFAVAFVLAALLNEAWYDWTNVAAVSAAAALGSIPLFHYLQKHPTT